MASPSPVLPALARARRRRRGRTARRRPAAARAGCPGPSSATVSAASVAVGRQADGDGGARRGVRAGVGQQVGQHLVQPGASPVTIDGLVGQVELPAVVGAGGVGVADRVDDEARRGRPGSRSSGRPASRRASSRRSSTSAVIRSASRLDAAQRVRGRRAASVRRAAGQLGVAADRGQRGAQLVAGVGDELAHPRLARPGAPSSAPPTWPSIRLSAAPTWPTSVRGSASSSAPARRARPRRGRAGVGAPRRRSPRPGAADAARRRTSTAPATPASDQRRAPATSTSIGDEAVDASLGVASGSPVTRTSPPCRGAATTPVVAELAEVAVRGRAAVGRAASASASPLARRSAAARHRARADLGALRPRRPATSAPRVPTPGRAPRTDRPGSSGCRRRRRAAGDWRGPAPASTGRWRRADLAVERGRSRNCAQRPIAVDHADRPRRRRRAAGRHAATSRAPQRARPARPLTRPASPLSLTAAAGLST